MMKIYKWSMFWIVLYMYSIIMIKADMEKDTKCSNYFQSTGIPVVTLCENSQANGRIIVIDGYYASKISYKSCSCLVKSTESQEIKFNTCNESPVNQNNCSSTITVSTVKGSFILKCGQSGSIKADKEDEINLVLEKTESTPGPNFCLILEGTNEASLNATCIANSITLEKTTESQSTATESTELICPISSSEYKNTTSESTEIISTITSTHSQSTAAESTEMISTITSSKSKSTPAESTEMIYTITSTYFQSTAAVSTEMISTITSSKSKSTPAESTEMISTVTSTESQSTEQYQISIETNDDNILYIGVGTGGGAVLLIVIILTAIVCKRRRHHKAPKESQKSQRCDDDDDDDDELKYNVLYNSSSTQSNTLDENRISYDIEGTYTTVDMDENSKTKQENTMDKSLKPNVAPKPGSSNLSDNGSNIPHISSVKHISAVDGGCEYAVVQKSKNSADKQTQKTIVTADNIEAEVDKTEDPPETQDLVDNTYAVVDKTKKRQNIDTSKNEMKDSAPEEGMSMPQKATGLTGEVTKQNSLQKV